MSSVGVNTATQASCRCVIVNAAFLHFHRDSAASNIDTAADTTGLTERFGHISIYMGVVHNELAVLAHVQTSAKSMSSVISS